MVICIYLLDFYILIPIKMYKSLLNSKIKNYNIVKLMQLANKKQRCHNSSNNNYSCIKHILQQKNTSKIECSNIHTNKPIIIDNIISPSIPLEKLDGEIINMCCRSGCANCPFISVNESIKS